MANPESRQFQQYGRIALDGIEPKDFDRLVDLLADWIVKGEVNVRFGTSSVVRMDFDAQKIAQKLKKSKLPEEACIGQLRYEIAFMVSGILTGHRTGVTSFLVANVVIHKRKDAPKPSKEQIRQEITARIQCVEDKIVTADLRRQYAVKTTAKNNTYLGTSWEVVQKRGGSAGAVLPGLAHATVRIDVQKPFLRVGTREFFFPFQLEISPGESEGLTLTMTLEDLQDLATNLERAAKALEEAIEVEKKE